MEDSSKTVNQETEKEKNATPIRQDGSIYFTELLKKIKADAITKEHISKNKKSDYMEDYFEINKSNPNNLRCKRCTANLKYKPKYMSNQRGHLIRVHFEEYKTWLAAKKKEINTIKDEIQTIPPVAAVPPTMENKYTGTILSINKQKESDIFELLKDSSVVETYIKISEKMQGVITIVTEDKEQYTATLHGPFGLPITNIFQESTGLELLATVHSLKFGNLYFEGAPECERTLIPQTIRTAWNNGKGHGKLYYKT